MDGRRRRGAALVGLAVGAAALTGCAQERSVEAFCTTMDDYKESYLEQMADAQDEGAVGLVTAVGAVGDLKLMWRDLADVAPPDIRTDVEAVRDAWEQQEEAAVSGDWLASIANGLLNSGSMGRVDAYVRQNCDS